MSFGSRIWRDRVPAKDATVVRRLKQAGIVPDIVVEETANGGGASGRGGGGGSGAFNVAGAISASGGISASVAVGIGGSGAGGGAGEPGVANVKVNLFDASYSLIATAYTNETGTYTFANLPANASFLLSPPGGPVMPANFDVYRPETVLDSQNFVPTYAEIWNSERLYSQTGQALQLAQVALLEPLVALAPAQQERDHRRQHHDGKQTEMEDQQGHLAAKRRKPSGIRAEYQIVRLGSGACPRL